MKELVNSMRNPQRLQLKAFFPIHQRRHAKPVNSRRIIRKRTEGFNRSRTVTRPSLSCAVLNNSNPGQMSKYMARRGATGLRSAGARDCISCSQYKNIFTVVLKGFKGLDCKCLLTAVSQDFGLSFPSSIGLANCEGHVFVTSCIMRLK
jgi:hypothetical protein